MSTSTVERTGDWESVPFTGGFAGLRALADDEFSGMVTTGPTRLFMTRGEVVGIIDGDVDDFADGGGTAREAPHPALPLLAVMQDRSEEVRAQYYTEETPLSEVDRTLADGNFTGYVELSENVLLGDYYQVYHQGRSMSVAYVGASERLITDDEAFEQADDEVGIYEVRPVDVEFVDIPEPADDEPGDDSAPTAAGNEMAADAAAGSEESTTDLDHSLDDTTTETDASSTGDAADAGSTTTVDDGPATEGDGPALDDAGPAVDDEPGVDDGPADTMGDSGTTGATVPGSTGEEPEASDAGTVTETSIEEPEQRTSETERTAAGTDTSQSPATTDTESTTGTESDASTGGGPASGDGTPSDPGASAPSDTAPTESSGSGGSGDATGGTGAGHAPQEGRTPSDHPAAESRERSDSAGGSAAADSGGAETAIGPADLEVHALPSLDPSRTASASRQERERRAVAAEPARSSQSEQSTAPAQSPPTDDAAVNDTDGGSADTRTSGQSTDQAEGNADGDAVGPRDTAGESARDGSSADASDEPSPPSGTDESTPADGTATSEDLAEAQAEVERLEGEIADLCGDHEAVVEERDRLQAELAEAREEIDRLRGRLDDATGNAAEASRQLSPREAIDETNLFVRYDSKGEATLEEAHAAEVDRDAVDANMRLQYHTSFDADDAAVDGVDFDTFLTDTVQYRFVDWLVRTLLYEIRDTGNTGPMGELYDALPKVDRAELNGQVGVQYTEDGQEHRAQVGFDVIVRDRMGNPLIVANLNDSRDPATDSMMTDLVRAAERVGETSSSLAGAFLVTRSFFEPGALETAEEATAGGLLNRGKQKSFVNLSRKGGYHLCLVEARNQEFHLAVPEL